MPVNQNRAQVITWMLGIEPIHMVFSTSWCCRKSYKKLARVGFEPTTTKFHSDVPTNCAIRPWVQLTLKAKFGQLLQFCHLFSTQISFLVLLCSVNFFTIVKILHWQSHECSGMNWHRCFDHWMIFRSSYRKLAWMGVESMTIEFSSDTPAPWAIRSWVQLIMICCSYTYSRLPKMQFQLFFPNKVS